MTRIDSPEMTRPSSPDGTRDSVRSAISAGQGHKQQRSRLAGMPGRPSSQLTFRDVTSHFGVIVALSALMGLLVAGLAIPFAGALGLGAKSLSKTVKDLPEELKAEPLAQRTRVLDSHGKPIATFYDQNRVNVPLSEIAPIMQKAIV